MLDERIRYKYLKTLEKLIIAILFEARYRFFPLRTDPIFMGALKLNIINLNGKIRNANQCFSALFYTLFCSFLYTFLHIFVHFIARFCTEMYYIQKVVHHHLLMIFSGINDF